MTRPLLPAERLRLPREPLVEAMTDYYLRHRYAVPNNTRGFFNDFVGFDRFYAQLTGLSERAIFRLRRGEYRMVAVEKADRICAAIEVPLSLLYPEDR